MHLYAELISLNQRLGKATSKWNPCHVNLRQHWYTGLPATTSTVPLAYRPMVRLYSPRLSMVELGLTVVRNRVVIPI